MASLKYSRQREAIKTFLSGRTDHPTADTVYTSLRETYPNISLGTVYRNLALLEQLGEITRISAGSGAEHYDADTQQHEHFICSCCHRVFDLRISHMDSIIREASSCAPGVIESCRTIFYGTCSECQKENSAARQTPS